MRLSAGTHGFDGQSEFFNAVRRAGFTKPDARLQAAAVSANELMGSDGGFLVPPDYQASINSRLFGPGSLLAYVDHRVVNSGVAGFPTDEAAPWSDSPGVQAYWVDEGAVIDPSKPRLSVNTVRLQRLSCLVPVTDELEQDSDIGAFVERKAPLAIEWKIAEGIVSGIGGARLLGIRNASATIVVAAEGAQTADTVNGANVVKMWARMWAGGHGRSVWIAHPDVLTQIPALNANGLNAYTGSDEGAPAGRIFGRPIIVHEACEQLGDLGDLILADLGEYLLASRTKGIKFASSIHVYFDQDLTAFRFNWRVQGMPWWSAPLPSRSGGITRSPFVMLAAR